MSGPVATLRVTQTAPESDGTPDCAKRREPAACFLARDEDTGRTFEGAAVAQNARKGRRRSRLAPRLETLEGGGFSRSIRVPRRSGISSSERGRVSGSRLKARGLIKVHPAGKGAIDLSAFGTNPDYHPQHHPGAPALPLSQSASFDPQADCHVWSARWLGCLRGSTDGDHDSAHEHDDRPSRSASSGRSAG